MNEHKLAALLTELPPGWVAVDTSIGERLCAELRREMAVRHPLAGCTLEAIARCTANDDVLFRHVGEDGRFTVVHLTWAQSRESHPKFPFIEFEGSFSDFIVAYGGVSPAD